MGQPTTAGNGSHNLKFPTTALKPTMSMEAMSQAVECPPDCYSVHSTWLRAWGELNELGTTSACMYSLHRM